MSATNPMTRLSSFLVDVEDQDPSLGYDPEVPVGQEVLVDVRWLKLTEIPERDRVFLWAAGLLGVDGLLAEVESWGNEISYPGQEDCDKPDGGDKFE